MPAPEGNNHQRKTVCFTSPLECTSEKQLNELHCNITNLVALHKCSGYCLRKKKQDSKLRFVEAILEKKIQQLRKLQEKNFILSVL